jgi:hypothetical protein
MQRLHHIYNIYVKIMDQNKEKLLTSGEISIGIRRLLFDFIRILTTQEI